MNLENARQAADAILAAAPGAVMRRPTTARIVVIVPWDQASAARTAFGKFSGVTTETRSEITVTDDWLATSFAMHAAAPEEYPYLAVADTVLSRLDADVTTLGRGVFTRLHEAPFGQHLAALHPATELLAALIRDAAPGGWAAPRRRSQIIIREALELLAAQPELITVAIAETQIDQPGQVARTNVTLPAASSPDRRARALDTGPLRASGPHATGPHGRGPA